MNFIISLIHSLGTAVCHQIDARTLHFNGYPLLVCARDTGTYTGFICSLIYWMIVNKKIKAGTPPTYAIVTAAFFIGTLVFDGGTSYLHIRETNNQIRLITGLLAGGGAAILIVPCVFELLYKYSSSEIFIKSTLYFFLWLGMIPLLFLIIRSEYGPLYYPMTFLITAGIITMLSMVNAVILVLIPPWSRKKIEDWKSLLFFLLPTLFAVFIELYISYSIHIKFMSFYPK